VDTSSITGKRKKRRRLGSSDKRICAWLRRLPEDEAARWLTDVALQGNSSSISRLRRLATLAPDDVSKVLRLIKTRVIAGSIVEKFEKTSEGAFLLELPAPNRTKENDCKNGEHCIIGLPTAVYGD